MKFLGLSGSLRSGSYNTALLEASRDCLQSPADWEWASIGDLPLYAEPLDGEDKPPAVERLIGQIRAADALVIATPEYNYSLPGGLKNAIDWASRPAYQSVLAHKPALIMSASMSPVGGARAQGHLKQILAGTLTRVFAAPEFAVGAAQNKFANGELVDDETRRQLSRLMSDFQRWLG